MGWRVTIKHKLIGILLIPLLAFTVASLQNIRQAHQQVQQMQQIQQLAQLVVYVGDLVHESQKERGHTAGFLGSQGQRFKTELAQQRGITDQKAQILSPLTPVQLGWPAPTVSFTRRHLIESMPWPQREAWIARTCMVRRARIHSSVAPTQATSVGATS